MPNKTFVYLDLVGFSSAVREKQAYNLLNKLHLVTDLKRTEAGMYESKKEDGYVRSESVEALNKPIEMTAVEYFQCISDSLYAIGEDSDLLVIQMANFIRAAFKLFWPVNDFDPIVLLRGGMGFGDVQIIEMAGINNSKFGKALNIYGDVVVRATGFEKKYNIKGPRVFFGKELYERLSENTVKYYVAKPYDYIEDNLYELLWPATVFFTDNLKDDLLKNYHSGELFKLGELLGRSAYYFDYFKSKSDDIRVHFDELNFLILRSAQHLSGALGADVLFKNYMKHILECPNCCVGNIGESFRGEIDPSRWPIEFRNYIGNLYVRL